MDIILTIDHLQAVHIGGCLQRASLTGHTPIIPENSLLDRWQALLTQSLSLPLRPSQLTATSTPFLPCRMSPAHTAISTNGRLR